MRFVLPILALLGAISGAADAATVCGAPQTPLLEVMSSFVATSGRPAPGFAQESDDVGFIFRDNTAVISHRFWEIEYIDGSRQRDTAEIDRGAASAASFRRLNAALAAMRAGFQDSCHLDGGGFGFTYDVTWHGWRTNRFVLTSVGSSLPPCSAEAAAFVNVLVQYLAEVAAAPATERLSIPPR
ncbi:MAG: hypothetical protein ACM3OB_01925 [Acidobacteriota bacterium]